MNFKSCLVFGFFAKVLQHFSGGMHPKSRDQASVSILSVAMVTTAYDIPLYWLVDRDPYIQWFVIIPTYLGSMPSLYTLNNYFFFQYSTKCHSVDEGYTVKTTTPSYHLQTSDIQGTSSSVILPWQRKINESWPSWTSCQKITIESPRYAEQKMGISWSFPAFPFSKEKW